MSMPPMEYRALGRTGLDVSLLSLGSGGPNMFGQRKFVPRSQIVRLIHRALELGINFFDTSAVYGESEAILGGAFRQVPRDRYILATKFLPTENGVIATPDQVAATIERSLKRLKVDTIDLVQFHRVTPPVYRTVVDRLLSTVMKLRQQGKFRFLGITESTSKDYRHEMLPMALHDNLFETIMVAYNFMNSTAKQHLLPLAQKKNIGVICMAAVSPVLEWPNHSRKKISKAKVQGIITGEAPDANPSTWLTKNDALSPAVMGYKYAAADPAIATVLTGTTNIEHLEDNARAILAPPMPAQDIAYIDRIFGDVSGASDE